MMRAVRRPPEQEPMADHKRRYKQTGISNERGMLDVSKSRLILNLWRVCLWCLAVSWSTPGVAFTLSAGQEISCKVHTVNGEYSIPEQNRYAYGFAGFTDFDQSGLPYFIFDKSRFPQVDQSSGILVDFLFYHECAHARFESHFKGPFESELGANCEGLRKMRIDGRITAAQEIEVGRFHANANLYATLFGSGITFWQLTLSCASNPPSYDETVYGRDPPPKNVPLGSFLRN